MRNPRLTFMLILVVLTSGLVLTVGPLGWMVITAFTPDQGSGVTGPTLDNFRLLFQSGPVLRWVVNSFLVAFGITAAQTLLNSLAAFGFSVGRFKGREALFMVLLGAMMVPGQIIMLPLFLLMVRWGLIDSLWAVIIPSVAAPFGIYMIRQYMDSIPLTLVEAARMDGASEFAVYRHVYLPLSQPILATSGIFTFITHWNAFLWPLVILNSEKWYTLTVGLATLQDRQVMDYGLLMAGATAAAVPMVIVFIVFSRYLLEGMRKGAIK